MVMKMDINTILQQNGITKYHLSKISGVPHTTLNDLCNGKTRIEKCSAETLYKISKALNISMESLIEDAISNKNEEVNTEILREQSYEYGLPEYLQNDLDNYKEAVIKGSPLIDCLWGELYGSINIAEISEGIITHEHAEYLRHKYLWR